MLRAVFDFLCFPPCGGRANSVPKLLRRNRQVLIDVAKVYRFNMVVKGIILSLFYALDFSFILRPF